MKSLFVDTAGWMAMADAADPAHEACRSARERARSWFFEGEDKDFSFTDCSSFVVMREVRSRTALTTDRHFAQAGFEVVP